MLTYTIRRVFYMVITLFLISIIAFVVIQLPPGSYINAYLVELRAAGTEVDEAQIAALTQRFGLDQPMHVQYTKWMSNILLEGDFGQSFAQERPVIDIIRERLPLTLAISIPHADLHLRRLDSDWHLFGAPPVLDLGLRALRRGLHRPGHPQFSAGAAVDVSGQQVLWHQRRRPLFAAV